MTGEAQPGAVIGGRYTLSRSLGTGGFGQVWEAHDPVLDVDVAVKRVLLTGRVPEEERALLLARAGREARNAARLRDHPHIVTVYDVIEVDEVPWIVMQLVDGHSLADEVKARGPLAVERAGEVGEALLRALGAAHRAGVMHRDVKPANVLLATGGEVLLADFGIATGHTDTRLTASSLLIGSPAYMAPERWQGVEADGRADLFSLGVTLYEAVEGVLPFPAGNPTAALTEPPRPPRRARELAPLLAGLLEKDPARRPTVEKALGMLRPAAGTTPLPTQQARPSGGTGPVTEPVTRPMGTPMAARAPVTLTKRRVALIRRSGINSAIEGTLFGGFFGGLIGLAIDSHETLVGGIGGDSRLGNALYGGVLLGAVLLVLGALVGLARGMTTPSDRLTVDEEGVGVTTRYPQRRRGAVNFTIRWDSVERVAIRRPKRSRTTATVWFREADRPTKRWLAENLLTLNPDGSCDIYTYAPDFRAASVNPGRLRDALRQFAGHRYGDLELAPER
ncbi:serine/threonine-protein kinase [Streptomyces iconiensis]|uniref:non-specific serine/threonine protein kinase n=1 Tax=Streptomyces iconiensis TaxID=1384038 RepID=A0ABT7A0A6_9ACTN|nr:serine/threonine-protein kinase [Streptomyces iconiensis]MDJ1134763.1 serine/threonine-protein kinase [Streptomyces iconiensis]